MGASPAARSFRSLRSQPGRRVDGVHGAEEVKQVADLLIDLRWMPHLRLADQNASGSAPIRIAVETLPDGSPLVSVLVEVDLATAPACIRRPACVTTATRAFR